jgi:hypothetical protein
MTEEEVLAAARADTDAQPSTPAQLKRMRRISPLAELRQAVSHPARHPCATGSSTAPSPKRANQCLIIHVLFFMMFVCGMAAICGANAIAHKWVDR